MKLIEHESPIDDPELLEYVRAYNLAAEPFCMPPTVQEEQPAVTLDWLLKISEAIAVRLKAQMAKKAGLG